MIEYYSQRKNIDPLKHLGADVQGILMDIFGFPTETLVEACIQMSKVAADMDMLFSDEVVVRYWWQVISIPYMQGPEQALLFYILISLCQNDLLQTGIHTYTDGVGLHSVA